MAKTSASRGVFAALLVALVTLVAAGCGDDGNGGGGNQGASAKKVDVASAGDVTLTVWDQEVRGGQAAQIKQLNSEFQKKYPNVKIKRVSRSFEDLQRTIKLAVRGNKAPDVIEANQGRPIMGELVKAKLLVPLDKYADAYGWKDRYSPVLLDLNRFSPDGKQFGSGSLYGLSQVGEIVGVYYNKTKVKEVPKTLADFEAQLEEAKKEGDIPIQFGNLEKFAGIHNYETVLAGTADKQAVRDFVFARGGASFQQPGFEDAAAKLKEWTDKGYFTPKANGTSYDVVWQRFGKGKGRFLIAGTWLVADLTKALKDDVGFFVLPPKDEGGKPTSLGGEGLPFTVTSKSKNPDVAAAYIDFLTDANAAKVLTETDNLPALPVGADVAPKSGLISDVFAAWKSLKESDGLIPYLDYTTPTAFDDISAAIQRLIAGKDDPKAFVDGVQKDYQKFLDKQ